MEKKIPRLDLNGLPSVHKSLLAYWIMCTDNFKKSCEALAILFHISLNKHE